MGLTAQLFNMCLSKTETRHWDLPQVKVHHYFLSEDSLVQAPGLKSPAYSSLSHCPKERMASVEEYEKLRGEAEVILLKLREACGVKAPNKRLVANMMDSLEIARDNLISLHKHLVMEMNAQLEEPRFSQYIDKWVDARLV